MVDELKSKPIINLSKVNVTYFRGRSNEVRALRDINLQVYPGEFIVFFGPSGCGKSTLLYSIAGLESHADGKIEVEGQNVAKMNMKDMGNYRQKKIGMIFQAFYLINSLSVIKNVLLPQMAIGVPMRDRVKRAKELLTQFGVGDQTEKIPSELSGGQQQRVAISRAIINNPDIILADEPVGNLDSKSANDVMNLLADLNSHQKKTIVLVTHDPSRLAMAHRVYYMKDGRIIETRVQQKLESAPHMVLTEDKPSVSKELELLIRTYSSIAPGQIGTMLIPFKAKQIVTDVLTGMTSEEVEKIEEQVRHLLLSSLDTDDSSLAQFLDVDIDKGGLGLDKRSAERIASKIQDLVKEIKELQSEEKKSIEEWKQDIQGEVVQLRQYILAEFDIHPENDSALKVMDEAIAARLNNAIDRGKFQSRIDRPIKEGGAGLDKRIAKKVAKRLELLILGKYTER